MNTKNSIIAIALLSSMSFYAGNGSGDAAENTAAQLIKEHISISSPSSSAAGKIEVLFTTNENGKVNFVLAKTEDKSLKKEIESQFNNITLPGFRAEAVNSVILNLIKK